MARKEKPQFLVLSLLYCPDHCMHLTHTHQVPVMGYVETWVVVVKL
jgi:hypothetical protein